MPGSDDLHTMSTATPGEQAADAQRALVELEIPAGQAVSAEACPGAGKTRTVVERHLFRPVPPRQGRAILSFTKVAGREIRRRCAEANRPELTTHPHFIGTIDTFIWRHLVRPYVLNREGRTWHRLESWNDHPSARQDGLSLDDFVFTISDEKVRVTSAALTASALRKVRRSDTKSVQRVQYWADQQISDLWRQGYLSGDQLRDMAISLLENKERRLRIGRTLRARFSEIVVDEAQACSSEDQKILGLIQDLGLPLLLVGDPDQAIYGFRATESRASSERPSTAARPNVQVRLRHNWRSTQVICNAAQTLRPGGYPADIAAGNHRDEEIPVLLLSSEKSRGADALHAFSSEAERWDIPREQRLVVAHAGGSLPRILTGSEKPTSTGQLAAIIWAIGTLRTPGAPQRRRDRANRILREAVLKHWFGELTAPEAISLGQNSLTKLELQRTAQAVLHDLPPLETAAGEWSRLAMEALDNHMPRADLQEVRRRKFPCPAASRSKPAWKLAGLPAATALPLDIGRASTVHQVKGEEADAVLVVIPALDKKDQRAARLMDAWLSGSGQEPADVAEALRVIYVAATRARRLLAFALPDDYLPTVERHLRSRHIPTLVLSPALLV